MLKYIVVVVVVLLIAALCFVADYALEDPNMREVTKRVEIYRIIEEEQRLTMEILQHKVAIAEIQARYAPKDPNSP